MSTGEHQYQIASNIYGGEEMIWNCGSLVEVNFGTHISNDNITRTVQLNRCL